MLDYEPIHLPHDLAWQTEPLPTPGLLLKLLAASRQKPLHQAPAQTAKTGFHPEHLSGLCAGI